jgi:prepilin-type N-terminal cleavage/methylation domain-containing protein
MRRHTNAFTLVEILVVIAVLGILTLLVSRLVNSAATITSLGTKRIESDGQVRQLFDRMAIDFAQMVKRPEVDFYAKGTSTGGTMTGTTLSTINDRIAFFSMVPGDYPSNGSESPFSLIAYKVNSSTAVGSAAAYTRLQRLARGLLMNGDSAGNGGASANITDGPIFFATAGPTISSVWSTVTSNATTDSKYELAAAQAFRFEYYYLLTNGTFSVTPWDASLSGHTNVGGMRDVAAIIVAIATIDPKSHVLLTNSQISTIAGTLVDYSTGSGHGPGWLLSQWQSVLDTPTSAAVKSMPRLALSSIRLYERCFYLTPTPQ